MGQKLPWHHLRYSFFHGWTSKAVISSKFLYSTDLPVSIVKDKVPLHRSVKVPLHRSVKEFQ
jgi:hypothetical protein